MKNLVKVLHLVKFVKKLLKNLHKIQKHPANKLIRIHIKFKFHQIIKQRKVRLKFYHNNYL